MGRRQIEGLLNQAVKWAASSARQFYLTLFESSSIMVRATRFAMGWIDRVEKALKPPGSRWRKFLRDIFIDVFLIAVSLWFTAALTANDFSPAPSGRPYLLEGGFLGLVAVSLLIWRGIYSVNVR